jgi:hypothetical protein
MYLKKCIHLFLNCYSFLSDVFVLKEPSEGSLTGNQTEPDSAFLSGNFP